MKDKQATLQFDGLDISVTRGVDGTIVIEMDGPSDEANDGKDTVLSGPYEGSPDFRVYMNDTLIYAHGQSGHDLGNEALEPSVAAAMSRLDAAMEASNE